MDPTTWKLIQAHQHQSKIGWTSFTSGLLSEKWAAIQQAHHNGEPTNGETYLDGNEKLLGRSWSHYENCGTLDVDLSTQRRYLRNATCSRNEL